MINGYGFLSVWICYQHIDVTTGTSWILMAQDIRMTCSLATPLFSGSGTNLLDAIWAEEVQRRCPELSWQVVWTTWNFKGQRQTSNIVQSFKSSERLWTSSEENKAACKSLTVNMIVSCFWMFFLMLVYSGMFECRGVVNIFWITDHGLDLIADWYWKRLQSWEALLWQRQSGEVADRTTEVPARPFVLWCWPPWRVGWWWFASKNAKCLCEKTMVKHDQKWNNIYIL